MNMFKPVGADSIESYIEALTDDRRQVIVKLHDIIQKAAPTLKPFFAHNMIGYGSFKYTNYKKEELDWPVIALASQKNYISVYVCALKDEGYIAEVYKDDLGKVSVGKSCVRFKKIEDLNMPVLKKMLKEAATRPGLPKS